MNRFVLDSYAIFALLEGTRGVGQVYSLLQEAREGNCELFMSTVNVGEVLYITERERDSANARNVLSRIDLLPITITDANREQTIEASHIKARGRVSIADSYAAATAKIENAIVVTGDPEFKRLEEANIVSVMWLIDD